MALPEDREPLPLREIYEAANYEGVMSLEDFEYLLTHVAAELEIPLEKLRVTDRFDKELKPDFWTGWPDGIAMLASDIKSALKLRKRKGERYNVQTLDDWLRLMCELECVNRSFAGAQ